MFKKESRDTNGNMSAMFTAPWKAFCVGTPLPVSSMKFSPKVLEALLKVVYFLSFFCTRIGSSWPLLGVPSLDSLGSGVSIHEALTFFLCFVHRMYLYSTKFNAGTNENKSLVPTPSWPHHRLLARRALLPLLPPSGQSFAIPYYFHPSTRLLTSRTSNLNGVKEKSNPRECKEEQRESICVLLTL